MAVQDVIEDIIAIPVQNWLEKVERPSETVHLGQVIVHKQYGESFVLLGGAELRITVQFMFQWVIRNAGTTVLLWPIIGYFIFSTNRKELT